MLLDEGLYMKFRLHGLFGDNMVLQQGQPVTVCGWAGAGSTVKVELGSANGQGVAEEDGRWAVTLPAFAAGGGALELRGTCGDEVIRRHNILIGEVWVCSGQSNMEAMVGNAPDRDQVLAQADWPELRLLTIPRIPNPVPPKEISVPWRICTPQSAGDFSKVAYHFGLALLQKLRVPIGLIDAARGGTIVEAWTPREELVADAEMAPLVDFYEWILPRHAKVVAAHRRSVAGWKPPGDSGNTKFAEGWADPATDVSDWPQMTLPCWWECAGLRFHGAVWFRRDIEIPPDLAARDLTLHLGACDKADTTYFNNVEVGSIPLDFPDGWRKPRVYCVPRKLIRAGKNTIAVRVFCNMCNAGMTGPAEAMQAQIGEHAILLAGLWRFQVELNLGQIFVPSLPWGPGQFNSPSILFNSLIDPLRVFRIRGAIWYQGESNEYAPERYARLFPAMIRGWRRAWQQGDFPFLFVQLPNFGPEEPPTIFWTKLRQAQEAALAEPATAMVPTIDIGEAMDLHPPNKGEVGRRLALAGLAVAYHDADPLLLSPRAEAATFGGGKVRVKIVPSDGGLFVKGDEAEGFTIAGKENVFVPAQARVEGDGLTVWSDHVPMPRAVRYAWADNPRCNLFNAAGLPLAPFAFGAES